MQLSDTMKSSLSRAINNHMSVRLAEMLFHSADALYAVCAHEGIESFLQGDTSFLLDADDDCGGMLECFVGESWAPYFAQIRELDKYVLFKINKHAFRVDQAVAHGWSTTHTGTCLSCRTESLDFEDVAFVGAYESVPGYFLPIEDEELTQEITARMATSEYVAVVASAFGSNWSKNSNEGMEKDLWKWATYMATVEVPGSIVAALMTTDRERGDGYMVYQIARVSDAVKGSSGLGPSSDLPETLYVVKPARDESIPWAVESSTEVPSTKEEGALLEWARSLGRVHARNGSAIAGVYLVRPHLSDTDPDEPDTQGKFLVHGTTSYGQAAAYHLSIRAYVDLPPRSIHLRERFESTYVDIRAFEALEQYWEGYREEREGIGLNVREV